jgi:hypothetical protein
VAITANTTLIASYFSTGGGYSDSPRYFTAPVVADPLRALANGEEGGNGVYCYGATTVFPDDSYQGTNYWVDVAFVPATGPAAVTDVAPSAVALLVSPNPSRGAPSFAIVSPAGGAQTVEVLDVAGRVRRVLTRESAVAGRWTLRWDGRDAAGRTLPAGLYFARLRIAGRTAVTRFAIVP